MSCHPEDDLNIRLVPAVTKVVREETPRMVVILVGKQDTDAVVAYRTGIVVVSPDDAQKQRSRRGHDGNVREWPAAVVVGQRVDRLEEEGVARDRAHGVVGDACGKRTADPRRVGEERVKATIASLGLLVDVV